VDQQIPEVSAPSSGSSQQIGLVFVHGMLPTVDPWLP